MVVRIARRAEQLDVIDRGAAGEVRAVIIPRISGEAYITAEATLLLDADDPLIPLPQ